MLNGKVAKLVDRGRELKSQIDSLDAELKEVKEKLKEEARGRQVDHLLGEKHFARVSPSTVTDCDARMLHELFIDLGRESEFFDCVKVLVTDAKSAIGETQFNSIANSYTTPYNKISFLEKIPAKYLK